MLVVYRLLYIVLAFFRAFQWGKNIEHYSKMYKGLKLILHFLVKIVLFLYSVVIFLENATKMLE